MASFSRAVVEFWEKDGVSWFGHLIIGVIVVGGTEWLTANMAYATYAGGFLNALYFVREKNHFRAFMRDKEVIKAEKRFLPRLGLIITHGMRKIVDGWGDMIGSLIGVWGMIFLLS